MHLTSAAGPGPEQKPKRSFEDIMGSGAATSLGFGNPLAVPQGFGAPAGSTVAAAAGRAALHYIVAKDNHSALEIG